MILLRISIYFQLNLEKAKKKLYMTKKAYKKKKKYKIQIQQQIPTRGIFTRNLTFLTFSQKEPTPPPLLCMNAALLASHTFTAMCCIAVLAPHYASKASSQDQADATQQQQHMPGRWTHMPPCVTRIAAQIGAPQPGLPRLTDLTVPPPPPSPFALERPHHHMHAQDKISSFR